MNIEAQKNWDDSFEEQIETNSYNTAPVEAIIRTISYHLRDKYKPREYKKLKFVEMGNGGGVNLGWLAQKGIRVSGIDISPVALDLCRNNLKLSGYGDLIDELVQGSVAQTPFASNLFDGVLEACVFQHLNKKERENAFKEVHRVLKPGGLFVGYMLDRECSVYKRNCNSEEKGDRGTINLQEKGSSKVYLQNLGVTHFYDKDELEYLLRDFSQVDCCLAQYEIPKDEALRRGYKHYLQSMWIVSAMK